MIVEHQWSFSHLSTQQAFSLKELVDIINWSVLSTQSNSEAEVVNKCDDEMSEASALTSAVEDVGVWEWFRDAVGLLLSDWSSVDISFSSHHHCLKSNKGKTTLEGTTKQKVELQRAKFGTVRSEWRMSQQNYWIWGVLPQIFWM